MLLQLFSLKLSIFGSSRFLSDYLEEKNILKKSFLAEKTEVHHFSKKENLKTKFENKRRFSDFKVWRQK